MKLFIILFILAVQFISACPGTNTGTGEYTVPPVRHQTADSGQQTLSKRNINLREIDTITTTCTFCVGKSCRPIFFSSDAPRSTVQILETVCPKGTNVASCSCKQLANALSGNSETKELGDKMKDNLEKNPGEPVCRGPGGDGNSGEKVLEDVLSVEFE
jgi:hypothetical protein